METLVSEERKLMQNLYKLKLRQLNDMERKLKTKENLLNTKEKTLKAQGIRIDITKTAIKKKEGEVSKKLVQEKSFHSEIKAMVEHEDKTLKGLLFELNKKKRHNEDIMKLKVLLMKQAGRPLRPRKDRSREFRNKINDLQKKLLEKTKELTAVKRKGPKVVTRTRTKVVTKVDDKLLRQKLAEQSARLKRYYEGKLKASKAKAPAKASAKAPTKDPKVKTTLHELSGLLSKLPQKELKSFGKNQNFKTIQEVFRKYGIE